MIRLSIVGPSLAVRAGLRALLESEQEFEVEGEAPTLDDPEALPLDLDVLVLLAEAADRSSLELALVDAEVTPGVLLVGEESEAVRGLAGLPLRGWGLLSLEASAEEFGAAVRALSQGLIVGSPALLDRLLAPRLVVGDDGGEPIEALTDRELEVLNLLAEGLANKQIAAELSISEHTVKFHVSSIYGKLGATNRAEAVRLGARNGLIVL